MKHTLLALLLTFTSTLAFSADFFWIGGTGDWSDVTHWSATSGGGPGATLPTNVDNVIFDDLSGLTSLVEVVTMDVAVQVNNFDFSGNTTGFTIASGLASIEIQGSLLANGLVDFTWTGNIQMNPSLVGNVITSNGQNWVHDIYFIGTETVEMNDDFSTTGSLFIESGGLVANAINVNCLDFVSNTANVRSIDVANSTITLTGTLWMIDPITLTWNATPSNVEFTNVGAVNITGGDLVYDTVRSQANQLLVIDDNTFTLLELFPSSTLTLENGSTQMIDSLVAVGDCVLPFVLNSANAANPSASIQKTGFNVLNASNWSINNVDALSPGTEVYNLALSDTTNGADGWIINATDFYWINASGNWSDPNQWSFSSGGPSAGCIPGVGDNVIFDDLSGLTSLVESVNMDIAVNVNNFDFAANTTGFTIASGLPSIEIQGNLLADGLVDFTWTGDIRMNPSVAGNGITSNGQNWVHDFYFVGTETVEMNDDFSTTGSIFIEEGGLVANAISVNCLDFISSTTNLRSIDVANSTITLNGTDWFIDPTTLTWTATPSTVELANVGTVNFVGGSLVYDTVRSQAAILNVIDDNTFKLLELFPSSTLTLDNGSTQMIDSLVAVGDCALPFVLNSVNSLNPSASIQKTGFNELNVSNLSIDNVDALSPGTEVYNIALSDTTNGADGWTLSGSVFYWIDNAGNWSDPNHWSLTSGGAPALCSPTFVDSVIFDNLSFTLPAQVVVVDTNAYFSYMDWSTSINNPTLRLDTNMYSLGDVLFNPDLFVTRSGVAHRIEFNAQSTFNPNSATVDCNIAIYMNDDSDGVNLVSELLMTDSTTIYLLSGQLDLQSNNVSAGSIQVFELATPLDKVLNLGGSTITLAAGLNSEGADVNFTFIGGTSDLYIGSPDYQNYLTTEGVTLYDVTLNFPELSANQRLSGNNTYNKLEIIKGSYVYIDSSSIHTINDSLIMLGDCRDSIYLTSSNPTLPVQFNKATGVDVIAECIDFTSIQAGAASMTALFSTDNGNNTNWVFDASPAATASFTADGPFCFGDTTMFTNNSTSFSGDLNDITSVWYFDDGTGYYANPPTDSTWINYVSDTNQHVFLSGGDFDVVLQTTYTNYCSDTDTIQVHISKPSIQITSTDFNQIICDGDEVTYEATSNSPIAEFQFYLNGVAVGGQSVNDTLFVSSTLNHEDTISVLSFENGCVSDTMPFFIITVNDLPDYTWTSSDADTSICAEDNVTFDASAVDPTYTYQYLLNNGPVTGYTLAGTYATTTLVDNDVVSLVGFSTDGCRDTLSMTFNVDPLPLTTLAESTGGNLICAGDEVTFTAAGAVTYEFFVDGVSQGAPSATTTWATTSLTSGQIVTVAGYSAVGCSKVAAETFAYTVNALPNVNMTTASATSICSGQNVVFNATGASQYEFFINGASVQGPSPTNSYASTTLADEDTVFVTGTFSGCGNNSDSIIFTVTQSPTTTLVSDATANTLCSQQLVELTAGGANNYEFFVNGVSQGAPSPTNTFSTSTLTNGQIVSVEGESNGCIVTQQISFTVLPIPAVSLFSDDADNTICDGEPITFTGANASQYEIFINDVSQGPAQASPTFNPALPVGNNTVYLIGTGANGCSDTSQTILNVVVHPIPTIVLASSDADDIICNGESVTFTGSGSTLYQFFIDGISQGSMTTTNTLVTTNLIDGQVISITGSANGCVSTSNTLTYTVNPVPSVGLLSTDVDNVFCVGDLVDFTASGADNYEFFVDGVSQGPSSPTTTINSSAFTSGTYLIEVFGEQNNCDGNTSISVTVNNLPSPTLVSSDVDNMICAGESVTYTASGGSLYEFFINGISQGAPSLFNTDTYSTLNDGDVVSIIATSAQGCSNNALVPAITVSPTPIVVLSSSDLDNIICIGESVTFTGNGADEFEFFINGVSQGAPSAVTTFNTSTLSNGDQITVNGSTVGCVAGSNVLNFTVHPYPVVALTNNGETEICENENTNLSATGAANYQFEVNGVPAGPFSPTATFNNPVNDGDIITVTGENNGCVSSASTSFQFTVYAYPILASASSDVDNIICINDMISFTASGASTYVFDLNGMEQQNGSTTTFDINTLEDGDIISITGFNGDCASATDQYVFTVNSMTLGMTVTPSTLICEGTPVTFTASGGDLYEFFLNGVSTGAMSATNTYNSSTLNDLDEVTFVAQSNTTLCVQDYNDVALMNVIDEPAITATTSFTFCEGDSVVLLSNASYGNQWYLDGNPIPGATDTAYVAYISGTYTLEATSGGTGQVWSFGVNSSGTFGNGNNFNNADPTAMIAIDELDEISSGADFMLGVSINEEVYAWGDNEFGQLGNGTFTNSNLPILVPTLSNIKTVATAEASSMAVTNTGDVYVWGENIQGQLATGNTSVINFPFLNPALTNVDTIAGGRNHFVILRNDGTVWATGNNDHGQLGQGNVTGSLSAIQVAGLTNVVAIGAGYHTSYAIDNTGDLYVWGNNGSGQLGLDDLANRLVPTLAPLKNVKNAQGGANHTSFVTTANEVYTTGGNVYGQLGLGDNVNRQVPTKVDLMGAQQISTGEYTTLFRRTDNSVFGTGHNNVNQLSSPNGAVINAPEHITDLDGVTFIEAGRLSSHVIFGESQLCTSTGVNTTMLVVPTVTITETTGVFSTVAGAAYQWFLDGNPIPGATNQNYTPVTAGMYTVEVTFPNGCVGMSEGYPFGIFGISTLSMAELSMYPNPTTGMLNLAFDNFELNGTVTIRIIDQLGRDVKYLETSIAELIQIDLTDIESGSYQAIIVHDDFEQIMRFVKTAF